MNAKPKKIIHAFAGLGMTYCGKTATTKNADGDPDAVTCPKCRKEMGE
jgi:hypothetical protein